MCRNKEGRIWAGQTVSSSALECGHLELWVIELVPNAIFSMDVSPVAAHYKVSALPSPKRLRADRSKASSPDRLSHLATKVGFR
jgi:hypothetical protein